jgi:hypothetical protein
MGSSKGISSLIFRTAYVEFEQQDSKDNSKELDKFVFKEKAIKVDDMMTSIPLYLGRRGNYAF